MSYLDKLGSLAPKSRILYGSDENDKPNARCTWQQVSLNVWGWLENGDHFRKRILADLK